MEYMNEEMIKYEKEVCKELSIPAIPKKEWDGKSSFKNGVAIINGDYQQAYAICSYDSEHNEKPRIIKVFDTIPFSETLRIFVVPSYMDDDVENWDLDEQSKQNAKTILDETKDLQKEALDGEIMAKAPKNEYFFDNIHSDDEGMAFIKSYNKANKVSGRLPNTHEGIVLRLGVIWSEQNKQNK